MTTVSLKGRTLNDFGFATYDADEFHAEQNKLKTELDSVKTLAEQAEQQKLEGINDVIARMSGIVELVMPLLEDLRDTAKEEYIRWPNRDRVLQPMIDRIRELQGEYT